MPRQKFLPINVSFNCHLETANDKRSQVAQCLKLSRQMMSGESRSSVVGKMDVEMAAAEEATAAAEEATGTRSA